MLLDEEMGRVERFWAWDARWWREREERYEQEVVVKLSAREGLHPELVERATQAAVVLAAGKRAYTRRQAKIREDLHDDAVRRHDEVQLGLQDMRVFGIAKDPQKMVEYPGNRRRHDL
jgi:hypothetical protein